ncbi:MAG TPA: hypothetical protein VFO07_19305, partial [Roseiflexaceae bacterium]|nr:hypothetical protein [Roseiflexaceae bacterium]
HGQATRAAQLLGAADGLRAASGVLRPPGERAPYERIVAGVRAQLDEATFAAAWATGQTMALDQATALALAGSSSRQLSQDVIAPNPARRDRPPDRFDAGWRHQRPANRCRQPP